MPKTIKERIIQQILENFAITDDQLKEAQALQAELGISLERALVKKGLIREEDVLALLVKELEIPFIQLKKFRIDPQLKLVIPEQTARRYKIVPVSSMENIITIATADPLNIFMIDDLKTLTGKKIDTVISAEKDIEETIENYYSSKSTGDLQDLSRGIVLGENEEVSAFSDRGTDLSRDEGDDAPVVRMINLMIREALKQRASDIHVEPMAEKLRVRYRIDGFLQETLELSKDYFSALLTRLKIMAGLDITKSYVSQEGRFKIKTRSGMIDFRMSILPTLHGQKIVLRILDKSHLRLGLSGLGFVPAAVEQLKQVIQQPFGLVLVTGPTGSGKSTTLYTVLQELNSVEKNIITIEDPVEYLVEGLTQVQVHPEIGLTFVTGLKALLRQNPDVVLVGEIRDEETADTVIKASLTGQLVLSTLHTNDSVGAMTRLVDMGVEPFLVASSLALICAQRLCRRICQKCKVPQQVSSELLQSLPFPLKESMIVYRGKGCEHCRNTGYWGRLSVAEVLRVDDTIRDMLVRGKSADDIKNYARNDLKMKFLKDDLLEKLQNGLISLEEALRVSFNEETVQHDRAAFL